MIVTLSPTEMLELREEVLDIARTLCNEHGPGVTDDFEAGACIAFMSLESVMEVEGFGIVKLDDVAA